MTTDPELIKDDPETVREERRRIRRATAEVVPGQAITKDTYDALGYSIGGKRTRNLTDDPMGWKPRPRPESPTT